MPEVRIEIKPDLKPPDLKPPDFRDGTEFRDGTDETDGRKVGDGTGVHGEPKPPGQDGVGVKPDGQITGDVAAHTRPDGPGKLENKPQQLDANDPGVRQKFKDKIH